MVIATASWYAAADGAQVHALRLEGLPEEDMEAAVRLRGILAALEAWTSSAPGTMDGLTAVGEYQSDGFRCIMLAENAPARIAARTAWDVAVIGLVKIEEKFPRALRVEIRGHEAS